MIKAISEQELKDRLSPEKSSEEIENLIDKYIEAASLDESPDMGIITKLVKKGQEEKLLRVRFSLESEQYDLLAAYFGEKDRPATVLAEKALEEFISLIT